MLRLDDTIRELAMEQPASLGEAQMRLVAHVVRVEEVVQLPLIDGGKGDSLGSVQLTRVELRWLDAVPLDGQLLLGEVLPHHPLDFLVRNTQQFSDDSYGDDGLRI